MVHGVTCLLLLAMTIAHRGDCLPLEPVIEMGIISPEMLDQLHHRLQHEEDLDKIIREIGTVQLGQLLRFYRTRPPHLHQPPLAPEHFDRLRDALQQQEERSEQELLQRGQGIEEPVRFDYEDPNNLVGGMEAAKRGGYMSLCHFKICNMGRKRSVGSPTPLLKSP